MATTIMNKRKFIDWLEKQLTDKQIILMTQDMTGSVSVNQKRNEKKVTFAFAADAYKRKDDIGHIAFGQTPMVAFSVCEKEHVSTETLKMIKGA
ncbi:MAG: hypothetical protein ACH34V_12465 [Flavobacterium sp.]|uniref:hypothetical protein n=1 Tax=Flavobacterium sp. TaxID=239 RepID=UPI00378E824F